ncbi:MAG: c-type cytochrome [Planctomycetes bacterium]|nr:c-type cytochrome [Planctomycetota bacterium]
MARKYFILLGCVIAGMIVMLVLPVSNLFIELTPTPKFLAVQATSPAMEQAQAVIGKKCLMCHAQNPSLPFYAKLPIASGMFDGHIKAGTARIDFVTLFEKNGADEVLLAKLEQSIKLNTMPMKSFLAMHWNGRLNSREKEVLNTWIRNVRAENYATGLASESYAADAVQPLPGKVSEPLSAEKIMLGDKLYHDNRLSGDDTLSCAGCHALDKGGTDNAQFSTGVREQLGGINAPTSFNAMFAMLQFWDGRALDLADQAAGPPLNPIEMDSNWKQITGKLSADAELTSLYQNIYGRVPWNEANITNAIAEFEKTLITPDSALDRYLKGDNSALSASAQQGYVLFKEHSCATCHAGKLMGGQSFEKPMDPNAYYASRKKEPVKDDFGRFNATENEEDRYKLKVPTLRNIALTYPYMHDGFTSDLKEVVPLMHTYFVPKLNRKRLSPGDVDKIVEMLRNNTGKLKGKQL